MANSQFAESLVELDTATIVDTFQQQIKNQGEWQDFFASSTGQTLIEIVAFHIAQHNYRWLRAFQEAFPTRAQQRENVIEGFSIFDYSPKRRVGSTVDLRFFLGSSIANDIQIPQRTIVEHDSGLVFSTTETGVIQAGNTEVTVPAVQGDPSTITVTSQGTEDYSIHIPSSIVEDTGITVNVDGTEWTEVQSLIEAIEGSGNFQAYEVDARPDETLDVNFGDGVQGQIPPQGVTIEVIYLETEGSDGTVFNSDSITSLQSTITDVQGNDVTNQISVSNDSRTATGGADRQTLDEIKRDAPRIFATGDRAVSKEDYKAIAEDYASVNLANAVGERNANPPNPDYSDRVEIYVIRERDQNGIPQPVTQGWAYGTSNTASISNPDSGTFLEFFNKKSDIDTVNEVFDAEQVWFFVDTTAFIPTTETSSSVVSDIESDLDNFLLESNNLERNIGDAVRESKVVELIEALSSVDHTHVNLIEYARKDVSSTQVEYRLGDFSTNLITYSLRPPFQPNTIEIYDTQDNLVASDNGQNNLNPGPNETNFQDGFVNYLDPDPQNIQSDISSGSSITISVEDASFFVVGDTVQVSDDNNSEEADVDSVDEGNDTITVGSLSNGYTTSANGQVDKIWKLEMTFNSAPNEQFQFEFRVADPRQGENKRDGDILVNNDQFAIYEPDESEISTEFI